MNLYNLMPQYEVMGTNLDSLNSLLIPLQGILNLPLTCDKES